MAIEGINSLSQAIKVYNDPKTSKDDKRAILAQFPDVVKYVGNDTTKYEISDEDFDLAKADGNQRAKDATGYDGGKSYKSVGSAVGSAAGITAAGASVAYGLGANIGIQNAVVGKAAEKAAGSGAKNTLQNAQVGAYVAAGIAIATAAKYAIMQPNKEQVNAARELYSNNNGLLVENQDELQDTQAMMEDAEEAVVEKAEEAEETNEEANDKIDEDKTKFDFYRAQYNSLKEKAASGEKLTKEEKALMTKLAPQMNDLGAGINETQEETTDAVAGLSDEIAEYQDVYDESAEIMANVEGVSDYAEGFDSNTKTMCTVEAVSQAANSVTGAVAAVKLMAGINPVNWALGIAAGAAGVASGFFASNQMGYAREVGQEIDYREQTQDLHAQTTEVYDEKLDTHAGMEELVNDLELEMPDDLEVPDAPTEETEGTEGGQQGTQGGTQGTQGTQGQDGTNPFSGANGGGSAGTRGAGDDGNGGVSDEKPSVENDPTYVNKMGKGSDWSEVANGNIKREKDSDIVTDSSGKVVMSRTYADAITNVTGKKEGEHFSKDDIPKILAKVLGSPFDEKMIKDVSDGKKLDSEYAAKLIQTKTGEEKGTTNVDNSEKATALAKRVIDFYYPIFSQASEKGWVRG